MPVSPRLLDYVNLYDSVINWELNCNNNLLSQEINVYTQVHRLFLEVLVALKRAVLLCMFL